MKRRLLRKNDIVCPFCFESFAPDNVRFVLNQNGVYRYVAANGKSEETKRLLTENNWYANVEVDRGIPAAMVFVNRYTHAAVQRTNARCCANQSCNQLLSPNAGVYPADNGLFILGLKSSGKTVYITSVIRTLSELIPGQYRCRFESYNKSVGDDYNNNYAKIMFEQHRLPEATIKKGQLTYEITNDAQNRTTGITFSDIKGEISDNPEEMNNESVSQVIKHSNYFLLTIDLSDPNFSNNENIIKYVLQNEVATDPGNKYLAVVITKSDMHRDKMTDKQSGDIFSSYSPIYKPVPHMYALKQNYLSQRYQINNSLRDFLLNFTSKSANIVMAAEAAFGKEHVEYFAVSALGGEPVNGTITNVEPIRVEEPVLWLLSHTGILYR